jgi:hypothetical protein
MSTDAFWKLDHCSSEQLLAGLDSIIRSCRQRTAELIAHLGEVEARRLHLEAACGSMFDYCVKRLGLSEDEACRRIDVARLARRFPTLFPWLASGEISLTVASTLKPFLTEENQSQLFACVAGKTVLQTREALAALFPRPDVAASVRKLPERHMAPPAHSASRETVPAPAQFVLAAASESAAVVEPRRPEQYAPTRRGAPPIEPLSEARYRVQFTASASLKEKLNRASDLMRHRNPSGDMATLIERALDLLLEQLMKERFAAAHRPRPANDITSKRVSNSTRRTVLERDGLQCSWVDTQGRRCESRAWLELDHRHPRAKGGGPGPENIRLLCRAHNRLAAEHAYGRDVIESAIASRRRSESCAEEPGASKSSSTDVKGEASRSRYHS